MLKQTYMYCTNVVSQNDAQLRVKRMGLDWMAFPDLVELVFVSEESAHSNHLSSISLKAYLVGFNAW